MDTRATSTLRADLPIMQPTGEERHKPQVANRAAVVIRGPLGFVPLGLALSSIWIRIAPHQAITGLRLARVVCTIALTDLRSSEREWLQAQVATKLPPGRMIEWTSLQDFYAEQRPAGCGDRPAA